MTDIKNLEPTQNKESEGNDEISLDDLKNLSKQLADEELDGISAGAGAVVGEAV